MDSTGDQDLNPHLHEVFRRRRGGHSGDAQVHASALHDSPASLYAISNGKRTLDILRSHYDPPSSESCPWLEVPEIPTAAELVADPTTEFCSERQWNNTSNAPSNAHDDGTRLKPLKPLKPLNGVVNKVKGNWESIEEYLGTHYRILREDALRPLREAVACVRRDPTTREDAKDSIGIYDKVRVKGLTFTHRGIATRVSFSLGRLRMNVRWEQSKRLLSGSLVVLLKAEDPSTCKVAIVAARQPSDLEKSPPEIHLFIEPFTDMMIDCQESYIMIEARGTLFEAQRHTLRALQKLKNEEFSMSRYLVDLQTEVAEPKYTKTGPELDMSVQAGVDPSQHLALQNILTKELALVQGPPGTGKTFVSVQAIQKLLQGRKPGGPPLIVASQTNHALDQLLRHISTIESSFVRLGSRSKDPDIAKHHTLFGMREKKRPPRSITKRNASVRMDKWRDSMISLLEPLRKGNDVMDENTLQNLGVLTESQAESLRKHAQGWVCAGSNSEESSPLRTWLGKQLVSFQAETTLEDYGFAAFEDADCDIEELNEQEAENVDEDDFDRLHGVSIDLEDTWTGSSGGDDIVGSNVERLLNQTEDIWKIRAPIRGTVYRHLVRKGKDIILSQLLIQAGTYSRHVRQHRIGRDEESVRMCEQQSVIGVTTTGISKYRALLSAVCPTTLLVEEAGETLEAPIIAACLPSIEHLILVGDHRQLRPHCNVKALEAAPFHLNISLFERLVGNNLPLSLLNRQRRMIPSIRRLLKPIYGNAILDHETVATRKTIPCLGDISSWFFTHEWPEERDQQMSLCNNMEARMVVGFVEYLLLNGVNPAKITVLTFYNGQKHKLQNLLYNFARFPAKVRVVTVDSYQGEENEIVVLSLVRSNTDGKVGFLSVDNRVCVALSRAKCGFYLFGNGELLCNESATWASVAGMMMFGTVEEPARRIGYVLPLKCSTHGRKTFVADPSDWVGNVGGCDMACGGILPCGHACGRHCHPWSHHQVHCLEECLKSLPCGHLCKRKCAETCNCSLCGSATCSISQAFPRAFSPVVETRTGVVQTAIDDENSRALFEDSNDGAISKTKSSGWSATLAIASPARKPTLPSLLD